MSGQGDGGRNFLTWPNPSCILYICIYVQIKSKLSKYSIFIHVYFDFECAHNISLPIVLMIYFVIEELLRDFTWYLLKLVMQFLCLIIRTHVGFFFLVFCLSICRRAEDNFWTVGPLISCILFVLQVVGLIPFLTHIH